MFNECSLSTLCEISRWTWMARKSVDRITNMITVCTFHKGIRSNLSLCSVHPKLNSHFNLRTGRIKKNNTTVEMKLYNIYQLWNTQAEERNSGERNAEEFQRMYDQKKVHTIGRNNRLKRGAKSLESSIKYLRRRLHPWVIIIKKGPHEEIFLLALRKLISLELPFKRMYWIYKRSLFKGGTITRGSIWCYDRSPLSILLILSPQGVLIHLFLRLHFVNFLLLWCFDLQFKFLLELSLSSFDFAKHCVMIFTLKVYWLMSNNKLWVLTIVLIFIESFVIWDIHNLLIYIHIYVLHTSVTKEYN